MTITVIPFLGVKKETFLNSQLSALPSNSLWKSTGLGVQNLQLRPCGDRPGVSTNSLLLNMGQDGAPKIAFSCLTMWRYGRYNYS